MFILPTNQAGVACVVASDNSILPADSLAQTFGYDGSGNLTSITVNYGGNVYVQTLGYTSGKLTSQSQWVRQ